MQKKKLISIAIALTLQSYYIPAIAAENNDDEKECPSNNISLPKEKTRKTHRPALATPGNDICVAALVAGVGWLALKITVAEILIIYTPYVDNGGDVTPPDDGAVTSPRPTMAA